MTPVPVDNVDRECFSCAIRITKPIKDISDEKKRKSKANEVSNTINKCLGILQENGVFAFYVYLKSEDENSIGEETIELLKSFVSQDVEYDLEKIKLLADDITNLIFSKTLIEHALIYARYHSKALGG